MQKRRRWAALLVMVALSACVGCGGTPASNVSEAPEETQSGSEVIEETQEMPATEYDTSAILEDTEENTEEYKVPETLDTTDVNYPVPYGDYLPVESNAYKDENGYWLWVWLADSNIFREIEEWRTATLCLKADSISLRMTYPTIREDVYENITYKKTRTLNKEELQFFSSGSRSILLDEYYANNSPCTIYDVCTEDNIVPYKIVVFKDKIWLMAAPSSGFHSMDDMVWYVDDLRFMIEFAIQ